jgi:uncharacterized protein YdcH (DUF465 family)
MLNDNELKKLILENEDFIKSFKHSNSLAKFLARNPKELDNYTISKLLMVTEEEIEKIYQESVDKMRSAMLDSKDED